MSEGSDPPPGDEAEGVPLIEGWMLGKLLFPLAMQEVERLPPSNDDDAEE